MFDMSNEKFIYALFGEEAIKIFSISLELLANEPYVNYKIAKYKDEATFLKDVKAYDAFLIIDKKDFYKFNAYRKLYISSPNTSQPSD